MLELLGTGAAMTVLAGCAGPVGDTEPDVDDTDDAAGPGEEPGDGDTTDNGVLSDDPGDTVDWDDVDTISLFGDSEGWIGDSPPVIDGETNPTLVLFEGREYNFIWENEDGEEHTLVIEDDEGGDIEATDPVEETSERASFTVEATEDMGQYHCELHPDEMWGEIDVETD